MASVSRFRLWNCAMRAYRGTTCCVAVEANPRFAVSAQVQPWHMKLKEDAGCGSGWSCLWQDILLALLASFRHKWQPRRFSVLVILAAITGFCLLRGLPIAWCQYVCIYACNKSVLQWSKMAGLQCHTIENKSRNHLIKSSQESEIWILIDI